MNTVVSSLWVGLGGLIGANARFWISMAISTRTNAIFPVATMAINISGSMLAGLMMGFLWKQGWNEGSRLFLLVGVLGGYTTFSTFSLDAMHLISQKNYGYFSLYVLGSVALSLFGTWLGLIAARALAG